MKNNVNQQNCKIEQFQDDCIFCKIVKGEIPSKKVYEDDYVVAILDISEVPENHTLVIPKVHVQNMLDASSEVLLSVFEAAKKVSKSFVSSGYAGTNVFVNNGSAAEQSVMHFHVHVIPRREGEGTSIYNMGE